MARERSEISKDYKWDLDKMYPDKNIIEKDIEFINNGISELKKYNGKLSDSVDTFVHVFNLMDEVSRKLGHYMTYANMKHHEDTRINENQANATRSEMLATEFSKASSYVLPEIMEMDSKKLELFLEDKRASHYRIMIEDVLRFKPYTLSEKEEKILAASLDLSATPGNVFEMLSNADMRFPEIENEKGEKIRVDQFNFNHFLRSEDQRVRKDAFEATYNTYRGYSNTFASTLFGGIKSEIFRSSTRHYPSALFASLYADNISVDVYNNLIESVHKYIPVMNRYNEIKKKFFGLEQMHMYDQYLPMARDFKMVIPVEEGKEIILKALEPMGKEYVEIVKKAFDERWIDFYENEGKRGGAYSWGSYDSDPYILMSYNDDINSLFTLIHELGHSVHSYYSRKNQSYIYADYKLFVAEVASTVNETLLIKYMLKNAKSDEEKIYLLNYYLEQFRTTVFRQTLFAEFEKITHEKVEAGIPLTAKEFKEIYYDLNKLYYGGAVEVDELIDMEWARIPHFYTNFYVYKYATGFSAASVLSTRILEGGEKVEQYKDFLKGGCSKYPLDLLRDAGVDMEKRESVEGALEVFKEKVEELEALCSR